MFIVMMITFAKKFFLISLNKNGTLLKFTLPYSTDISTSLVKYLPWIVIGTIQSQKVKFLISTRVLINKPIKLFYYDDQLNYSTDYC